MIEFYRWITQKLFFRPKLYFRVSWSIAIYLNSIFHSRKPISSNTLKISRETVIIHSNANNTSEFCKNKQKDHHKHIYAEETHVQRRRSQKYFLWQILNSHMNAFTVSFEKSYKQTSRMMMMKFHICTKVGMKIM